MRNPMPMDTPIAVLLVEDHASYRQGLAMLVGSALNMRCVECASGEEALRLLEEEHIDVAVMDIDLPGMDGITCTRTLKERHTKVEVLMCTVFEDEERIFEALKAGANGYVVKQAPIRELLDAIEQVHMGGSPMSAGIARKVVSTFHRASKVQDELTPREVEILNLIAEGLSVKEIADRACVSNSTVRTHIRHIYEKLQVRSRVEAVNRMRGI
jgi:DNA-binding NarL/FixJ family response regulator